MCSSAAVGEAAAGGTESCLLWLFSRNVAELGTIWILCSFLRFRSHLPAADLASMPTGATFFRKARSLGHD